MKGFFNNMLHELRVNLYLFVWIFMPPDNDNTIAINSQCYSTMTINVCNYAFIVKVDTG